MKNLTITRESAIFNLFVVRTNHKIDNIDFGQTASYVVKPDGAKTVKGAVKVASYLFDAKQIVLEKECPLSDAQAIEIFENLLQNISCYAITDLQDDESEWGFFHTKYWPEILSGDIKQPLFAKVIVESD